MLKQTATGMAQGSCISSTFGPHTEMHVLQHVCRVRNDNSKQKSVSAQSASGKNIAEKQIHNVRILSHEKPAFLFWCIGLSFFNSQNDF